MWSIASVCSLIAHSRKGSGGRSRAEGAGEARYARKPTGTDTDPLLGTDCAGNCAWRPLRAQLDAADLGVRQLLGRSRITLPR